MAMMFVGFPEASAGGNDSFTKLLLHCDGADASTTFTDSAAGASAHTITKHVNAQIDTAQSKFGGASALFDASSYLTGDGASNLAPGSGDFTIDFWVRFSSVTFAALYDGRPALTEGAYSTIYTDGTHILYYANSADQITGTTALSSGTWYHIALARSGTSTKLFLNGTQEGATYSDSTTYLNGANRPIIGATAVPDLFLNGWMDEVRVSIGIARWTGNFALPTAAYS